jgi:hypothetical protein
VRLLERRGSLSLVVRRKKNRGWGETVPGSRLGRPRRRKRKKDSGQEEGQREKKAQGAPLPYFFVKAFSNFCF